MLLFYKVSFWCFRKLGEILEKFGEKNQAFWKNSNQEFGNASINIINLFEKTHAFITWNFQLKRGEERKRRRGKGKFRKILPHRHFLAIFILQYASATIWRFNSNKEGRTKEEEGWVRILRFWGGRTNEGSSNYLFALGHMESTCAFCPKL